VAVHNPLDYKQAMNDSDAIKKRMVTYLLPVVVAAIVFNVPKFFEATFLYVVKEVRVLLHSRSLGRRCRGATAFLAALLPSPF
jgi:hypothetical protein